MVQLNFIFGCLSPSWSSYRMNRLSLSSAFRIEPHCVRNVGRLADSFGLRVARQEDQKLRDLLPKRNSKKIQKWHQKRFTNISRD